MKGEGKAKRDKAGVVKMRCLAFEPELRAKNIREGQREKLLAQKGEGKGIGKNGEG